MDLTQKKAALPALVARTQVFLLDMDGTVYIGDTSLSGMSGTLAAVRESGRRIVYCTNNSSRSRRQYAEKLRRLGLFDARDEVYTSGMATAEYLAAEYGGARVYLVGTDALREDFEAAGVRLCEEGADVCVLAYDTTLTFEKLRKINEYIVRGAPYIATHPDDVCPAEGVYPPDVGSFIRLLACSSGREPDVVCGKPNRVMGERLLARLSVPPAAVTMAGDRPHTDIRFANNNGFGSLLVLSGETDARRAQTLPASDTPTALADSLNDVVRHL